MVFKNAGKMLTAPIFRYKIVRFSQESIAVDFGGARSTPLVAFFAKFDDFVPGYGGSFNFASIYESYSQIK